MKLQIRKTVDERQMIYSHIPEELMERTIHKHMAEELSEYFLENETIYTLQPRYGIKEYQMEINTYSNDEIKELKMLLKSFEGLPNIDKILRIINGDNRGSGVIPQI